MVIPLAGMLMVVAANADDLQEQPTDESSWKLGVALGYGQRSNPLAYSDNVDVFVDLDVGWFGERWFMDNGDLGLSLVDSASHTLNLVGRFNSDRVFFSKTDSEIVSVLNEFGVPVDERVKVPDRDYAVELGLEFLADGEWGYLQATAFHDVSNTHAGYELYVNYGHAVRRNRWLFDPSLGISWKSRKLNDYYWGVRQDEANPVFAAHEAGAGLNFHARLQASYQIDKHWAVVAVLDFERINSGSSRESDCRRKSCSWRIRRHPLRILT